MFGFKWFGLVHECIGKQVISYVDNDNNYRIKLHVYFFENKFGSRKIKYDVEYVDSHFIQFDSSNYRKNLLKQHHFFNEYIQPWLNGLIDKDELFVSHDYILKDAAGRYKKEKITETHKEGNVIFLNQDKEN